MATRTKRVNRTNGNRNKKMRITKRIVNTKRHTTGYVVGGKALSVAKTRQLAAQGRIYGVKVVGNYIQASDNSKRRLYDLPIVVQR